ncbi:flagellar biosynthetic protein FliO [Colwellia psychrerythraea]|uniref:Flagellar protein n=1 Tax=Colwellia psychrerythraea TaxID=28229 RepID=A0A099L3L4_COLPS|nr:flagellar biosynthetic protein FliO [Colwellia psychrerythraea]KGJ97030.1 flagellar biosynthetic protein FliO [Colwellia psychrerythraea]
MNVTRSRFKNIQSMTTKTMRIFLVTCCYLLSWAALAQSNTTNSIAGQNIVTENSSGQNVAITEVIEQESTAENSPQVGKHVRSNMNAGSMILSLLMVLALIIICAFVLKRFKFTQQGISQLKVITSLSLGTKERIMVVQVGEQQLLLGVTAGKITLLDKLSEPLVSQNITTGDLPKNILSFLSAKRS